MAAPKKLAGLNKKDLIALHKNMVLSRFLDNKMLILLKQGKGYFHIGAAGHEAIQTAAAFSMKPGKDYAYPYYRDLAYTLQFGVSPLEVMLQFMARGDDPSSGGRQMSNHYGHRKQNIVSQSSPTGTQFLQAVGCGLGIAKKGKKDIVYVSSGEGTTAQGDFHEALNWASRDKLPVIFVIQNNEYAISVHVSEQMAGSSVYKIGGGYEGLIRYQVDGTDFFDSLDVMQRAVKDARTGKGAVLIEARTVRLMPHSSSDSDKKYRKPEELEADRQKDPIPRFEKLLIENKIASEDELEKLKVSYKKEVDDAADQAENHNHPNTEKLYLHLFSDKNDQLEYETTEPSGDKCVLVDAINHALKEEMKRNENT